MTWLDEARVVVSKAKRAKTKELFFQPQFKGKSIDLIYRKFQLTGEWTDAQKTVLRKSQVPLNIRGNWKDWGGQKPLVIVVHGLIVNMNISRDSDNVKLVPRFIATSVTGPNGEVYHNQLATMNLLHCRNFITSLPFSGWMPVKDVNKEYMEQRLKFLRQTIRRAPKPPRLPLPIGIRLFSQ